MLERHMLESETMEGLSFLKPAFSDPEQHMTIDQCCICPWGSSSTAELLPRGVGLSFFKA